MVIIILRLSLWGLGCMLAGARIGGAMILVWGAERADQSFVALLTSWLLTFGHLGGGHDVDETFRGRFLRFEFFQRFLFSQTRPIILWHVLLLLVLEAARISTIYRTHPLNHLGRVIQTCPITTRMMMMSSPWISSHQSSFDLIDCARCGNSCTITWRVCIVLVHDMATVIVFVGICRRKIASMHYAGLGWVMMMMMMLGHHSTLVTLLTTSSPLFCWSSWLPIEWGPQSSDRFAFSVLRAHSILIVMICCRVLFSSSKCSKSLFFVKTGHFWQLALQVGNAKFSWPFITGTGHTQILRATIQKGCSRVITLLIVGYRCWLQSSRRRSHHSRWCIVCSGLWAG